MAETQLDADSYPQYTRSSPDNGGQVSTISMRIGGSRVDQQVVNRWIQQTVVTIHELSLQCRTVHVHQVCNKVCTQRM